MTWIIPGGYDQLSVVIKLKGPGSNPVQMCAKINISVKTICPSEHAELILRQVFFFLISEEHIVALFSNCT